MTIRRILLPAKNQSGFTLIELLLVMALFAMLVTALSDMFSSALNVSSESQARSAVTEDGRFLLARLSYDIGQASAVTTPAALGDSGPTLAIVVAGDTYTYAVSGDDLQLTNADGVNNLNSSETIISGLSFQRIGNAGGKDTVRVTFTVTSRATPKQGNRSETYTTTVGLR